METVEISKETQKRLKVLGRMLNRMMRDAWSHEGSLNFSRRMETISKTIDEIVTGAYMDGVKHGQGVDNGRD